MLRLLFALLFWKETNLEIYHWSNRPGQEWHTIVCAHVHTCLTYETWYKFHGLSLYCTTSFNKAWIQVLCKSNHACSVSEMDLWRWSQLEIRLKAFCWSTTPQKQFLISIIINSNKYDFGVQWLNSLQK